MKHSLAKKLSLSETETFCVNILIFMKSLLGESFPGAGTGRKTRSFCHGAVDDSYLRYERRTDRGQERVPLSAL